MKPKINYALYKTRLGPMVLAATEKGLCALQFADPNAQAETLLSQEFPLAVFKKVPVKSVSILKEWGAAFDVYLKGERPLQKLPLDIQGTDFQRKVWGYLQTIPSGETRSYSQVAKAIGKPRAFRAAASACARNHLAIAIPCHRIIHGSGNVSGYRWGLERKRALLSLERRERQNRKEFK